MMLEKMAAPDLHKYILIIITNKILLRDSSYIVNLVMWPKFGNSGISVKEVIITSIYKGLTRKTTFFWGVVLVNV